MTQFIPSPEQNNIDHATFSTNFNLAISALAGTGKTSTLVWIAKRLPKAESKIFCAFNADIVKDLQSKLDGTGVTARTFHSLGLGALKKYLDVKELPPKDDKYRVLVNKWAETDGVFSLTLSEALQDYEPEERGEKAQSLRKDTITLFVNLLDLIRVKLVAWDDVASMASLIAMNRLDVDVPHDGLVELVIRNVAHIMKQAEAETRKLVIDFTDMIYWAVKWNLRIYPYKWVLVDEAQDFNPLQREMIAKIIDPKGGRIILVGDINQAIYAFAGADSDSFDLSVKRWNCTVLPLNTTRRCSRIITEHASRLVPDFNCPPDKPRGKIVWIDEAEFSNHVAVGDMVVSRVTAPLVKEFLGLIAKGIPSIILGKDMSKQFIALLDKLTNRKDYTFPNLLTCLASHESEQVDHATQKGDEALIEAIRDQCAGLRSFIEAYPNMSSIEGLTNKIKDLLGDSKPKDGMVIFCTVHKSKGLEADRVFILAPDKLPLMLKDMSPEQLQQEYNLLYVAETRAKNTLVIVTNPKFLKDNSQPSYVQNDFEDKVWDAPVPDVVTIEAVTPEPVAVETPIESTETFPSFHTVMSEVLGSIGTTHVLYALNDNRKMCVFWSARGVRFTVKSIAPDGTESHALVVSRNDTLQIMKEFQPQATHWQFLTLDEWEEIYTPPTIEPVVDAVFKPDGLFVEAFTPPSDTEQDFFLNIGKQLETLPNSMGLFAVDGDHKMYVSKHIAEQGIFFVETVNGEYTQEALGDVSAIGKMYAFSPIISTWNTISSNDWMFATAQHKTMKERKTEAQSTPLVEASAPLPFASLMKPHLTELLTTYEPDRGLCADGKTSTMYISANWEDVYMVYERDYGQENDFNWSRDTKDKSAESVLKKMEAINPNPDAWRIVGWGDWLDGTYNTSTDEQESPAPMVEPPAVIKASIEQPVIVADEPPTPSADALLIDMLVKAMYTTNGEFGKSKLTVIANQLHPVIRSVLPEMDWTDTIRARVKVSAKRIMRQHNYPPKNSYPPESIDSVADAICHIYEHGALPVTPPIPFDENSPYQVWKREQEAKKNATKETGDATFEAVMTPRIRALVAGSNEGLSCNHETSSVFVHVAVNKFLSFEEYVYASKRHDISQSNPDSILTAMKAQNPNPDEWELISFDDWYKSAVKHAREIEASQPVAPVIAPVPDETPADITPTFSNGENPPSYQNGKDISPTPAPLPSTAPDMLKALIEQFRPFALTELDLVLQAIEYIKREKTEGAGV